jgi:outer membrane protein assembly factor BamB
MPALIARAVACTLLALLPSLHAPSLGMAADWAAWRGPAGTGQSDAKGFPTTWSPTENVKWKVALDGPGNSTPIAVGTKVFITHSPAKSTARGLHCFDRQTGAQLWKHQVEYTEPEPTHGTNPFCAASPVSDGERVVAWYGSPGVFCYDLAGNVLWQKNLGKVEHIWGYGSSPIIHENLVILNYGPGLNAFVVALDKKSGDEVWRKEYPAMKSTEIGEFRGSWSTPVLHKQGDRTVLLLSLPEKLRAVDPKTGDDIWTCDGPSKLVYTSPLVAGDIVVTMCGYGGPAFAVKPAGEGDQTAARLWMHDRNPQRVGSGVVAGDYLYILNEPGNAWCLDPKTGDRKWEQRLGSGNSWSSMTHIDGRLYIANTAGTTFVLEANPAECKIIAENKLGELTRGSHAFSDGQIFVRTYESLYCIEAK